jgi:hypothetical protein
MYKIIIFLVFFITSCATSNKRDVSIKIYSEPTNASLYINNQYYGTTPMEISLIPDRKITYIATIEKDGYQNSQILETWASVRGGRGKETMRCIISSLTMAFSVKCRDFKQKEYLINLF